MHNNNNGVSAPMENTMALRNGTNYSSPSARISISESDIIDKRDDLFYEITTTGSAAGYSLHDLLEIVDDEFKDNMISMLMRGIDVDETKEYAKEKLQDAFKDMLDDEFIEQHIIDEAGEY
tara:strand:+ start:200 stop:562 length:363 start_codon:yes stop_codon:yes gene_type:complete